MGSSTSTVSSGATTSASVITTQPPPYTATGSVTVPLRGGLPQSTISGGIPGAPTNIIRGPPPPYPGPGLAPNTASAAIGGNATNQTSKEQPLLLADLLEQEKQEQQQQQPLPT